MSDLVTFGSLATIEDDTCRYRELWGKQFMGMNKLEVICADQVNRKEEKRLTRDKKCMGILESAHFGD